ncbi:hypothetical protein D3C81_1341980 [compost metagenome]
MEQTHEDRRAGQAETHLGEHGHRGAGRRREGDAGYRANAEQPRRGTAHPETVECQPHRNLRHREGQEETRRQGPVARRRELKVVLEFRRDHREAAPIELAQDKCEREKRDAAPGRGVGRRAGAFLGESRNMRALQRDDSWLSGEQPAILRARFARYSQDCNKSCELRHAIPPGETWRAA